MKILIYNELNHSAIPGYDKLKQYLENDDFKSADVKKVDDNLYRARLNYRDRLLFSIYHYHGQRYALILEFIKNHAYEKSRFLRQARVIDEDKIPSIETFDDIPIPSLAYLNTTKNRFNVQDKIISFDDSQYVILDLHPPLIIIGSAGSGKTALTLEKIKQATGDVLYVTQSEYLVRNSRDIYYANNYDNPDQRVNFLSFRDFLNSIHELKGKAVDFRVFRQWFSRARQGNIIKDPHKLFEEFRGVLTGTVTEKNWLSREDYRNLGIKEST